ncbi:MAG: terpene cyclase/mutase family protein [Clostridiales Family XIII bacterium]|nr:terpene cyclase/mutase family protein [Clostridiales Family XIII bacterium]
MSGRFGKTRGAALLIILLCAALLAQTAYAEGNNGDSADKNVWLRETADRIIAWRNAQGNFADEAGSSEGDWFALGTGRLGVTEDYRAYRKKITRYVEEKYKTAGLLDKDNATEWHRISVALLAAGGDPIHAGTAEDGSEINLIADGVYDRGATAPLGAQGTNGLIWGLIAVDAMRYKIPADASMGRADIICAILSSQMPDGSFSLDGSGGNIDITAMALTALAPYYNSEERFAVTAADGTARSVRVRDAADRALAYLAQQQGADGGFTSWGDANSESAAQVIVALCAVGIDPDEDARFIKNGVSVLDVLLDFEMPDGGFAHVKEQGPDSMAGEHALRAIVSVLRLRENRRGLFDFRAEISSGVKAAITELENGIALLSRKTGESGRETVTALFDAYKRVPPEERSYVFTYHILADAMEQLKIKNDSEALSAHMDLNDDGRGAIIDVISGKDLRLDLDKSDAAAEAAEKEVAAINTGVLNELYPFDEIGFGDRKTLRGYLQRIEKLDEKYRGEITGYAELTAASKKLDRLPLVIGAVAVAVAFALAIIILLIKRRKPAHEI